MSIISKDILEEVNKYSNLEDKVFTFKSDIGQSFCILTESQFKLIINKKEIEDD